MDVALIDAAALAAVIGAPLAEATRLLVGAALEVNAYAPDAPDDAKSEAIVRLSGYTFGSAASSYGAIRSVKAGDVETSFAPMHAAGLRASGGASVLSQYRVRRATIIGADA